MLFNLIVGIFNTIVFIICLISLIDAIEKQERGWTVFFVLLTPANALAAVFNYCVYFL